MKTSILFMVLLGVSAFAEGNDLCEKYELIPTADLNKRFIKSHSSNGLIPNNYRIDNNEIDKIELLSGETGECFHYLSRTDRKKIKLVDKTYDCSVEGGGLFDSPKTILNITKNNSSLERTLKPINGYGAFHPLVIDKNDNYFVASNPDEILLYDFKEETTYQIKIPKYGPHAFEICYERTKDGIKFIKGDMKEYFHECD